MLTETAVSAILQASITGAGLVLAVYALIAPLSRRIFKERAKLLQEKIEEFNIQRDKITLESSEKDIKNLGKLKKEIKGIKIVPRYMGVGIASTFVVYIFSIIVSTGWLTVPSSRTPDREFLLFTLFMVGSLLFVTVGLFTIVEVYFTMKKEFEEIKKKQKEVK